MRVPARCLWYCPFRFFLQFSLAIFPSRQQTWTWTGFPKRKVVFQPPPVSFHLSLSVIEPDPPSLHRFRDASSGLRKFQSGRGSVIRRRGTLGIGFGKRFPFRKNIPPRGSVELPASPRSREEKRDPGGHVLGMLLEPPQRRLREAFLAPSLPLEHKLLLFLAASFCWVYGAQS